MGRGVNIPSKPPMVLTYSDGHWSGQYAPYWNTFLLFLCLKWQTCLKWHTFGKSTSRQALFWNQIYHAVIPPGISEHVLCTLILCMIILKEECSKYGGLKVEFAVMGIIDRSRSSCLDMLQYITSNYRKTGVNGVWMWIFEWAIINRF